MPAGTELSIYRNEGGYSAAAVRADHRRDGERAQKSERETSRAELPNAEEAAHIRGVEIPGRVIANRAQRRMHGAVARDKEAQARYYANNREKVLAQDRARRAAMKADPIAYRKMRAAKEQRARDRDMHPNGGAEVRQGPCVCGRLALSHRAYFRETAIKTVLYVRGGAGQGPGSCPKYVESDASALPTRKGNAE